MLTSPPPKPINTAALSQRVSRVLWMRDWFALSARYVPIALGVALVLVIADRWWFDHAWWWGIPIDCVILAVLIAGVVAWTRRPDPLRAAGWLDASAHTQSRYRSAMELAGANSADPAFSMIAVERAEQTAASAKLPANQSKRWHELPVVYTSAILIALIVIVGIFMPTRPPSNPAGNQPSPLAIADARDQIQSQQEKIEELAEVASEDDPLIADALEDLAALEEELTQSDSQPDSQPDPESSKARADSRIEQLADELDERSEQQRRDEQTLRDHLDKIKSESLSDESDLDRFREQLSEGRYDEAIEELDAMNESLDSMTEQEREQIAEDLDSMADAMEPEDSPQPEDQPEPQADRPDPVDAENLSEALKDQAEQIREHQPESAEPEEPQDQEQQDPQQSEPEDQSQQQSEPKPEPDQPSQGDQQQESSEQQQQQDGSESESQSQDDQHNQDQQSQEQPGQDQQDQEQPGQEQSDQKQPGEDQQGQDQSQEQQHQPTDSPSESEQPGSEQQPEPTQDPESSDNQQQQEQQPTDQPGDQPEQTPQPQPGEEQQSPQPPKGEQGESTLREMLEEAQRQSGGADQDRRMAERLREQFEQSDNDQSPPNGFEPSPNPDDQQGSAPGDQDEFVPEIEPADQPDNQEYVPVQAADEQAQADDSSTPVGQWYNPDEGRPDPNGQSQTAERFRNAARKAREQVDDRRVPRRYRDVIRDYFKQLDQRAKNITPSTDGSDAPDPQKSAE